MIRRELNKNQISFSTFDKISKENKEQKNFKNHKQTYELIFQNKRIPKFTTEQTTFKIKRPLEICKSVTDVGGRCSIRRRPDGLNKLPLTPCINNV